MFSIRIECFAWTNSFINSSMCEAESTVEIDSMVEAIAGDTGTIYLQAKDVFGNNRRVSM